MAAHQRWPSVVVAHADTLVNVNSEAFANMFRGSDGPPAVRRCFNVTALYRKSGG